MTIEVPTKEAYYPKYVGWYVTVDEKQLRRWEKGEELPSSENLLRKSTGTGGSAEIKYPGRLWAYLPENEFGVVSP